MTPARPGSTGGNPLRCAFARPAPLCSEPSQSQPSGSSLVNEPPPGQYAARASQLAVGNTATMPVGQDAPPPSPEEAERALNRWPSGVAGLRTEWASMKERWRPAEARAQALGEGACQER